MHQTASSHYLLPVLTSASRYVGLVAIMPMCLLHQEGINCVVLWKFSAYGLGVRGMALLHVSRYVVTLAGHTKWSR